MGLKEKLGKQFVITTELGPSWYVSFSFSNMCSKGIKSAASIARGFTC